MKYRIRHELFVLADTEKEALLMWQIYSLRGMLTDFHPKVEREDEIPVEEGGTARFAAG